MIVDLSLYVYYYEMHLNLAYMFLVYGSFRIGNADHFFMKTVLTCKIS